MLILAPVCLGQAWVVFVDVLHGKSQTIYASANESSGIE